MRFMPATPPRCRQRHGPWRCSLELGHPGGHTAYLADQDAGLDPDKLREYAELHVPGAPPTGRLWTSLHDLASFERDPETPAAVRTNGTPTARSHHLRHPGAWMPEASVHPPLEEEPDDERPFDRQLAWEDMMPWERQAYG